MIVDDEPDISELLEKALKIEGFQKLPEKGVFRSIYAALNQMDAEIRRSDRMKEETERTRREWIANITHDLKTPSFSDQGICGAACGRDRGRTADGSGIWFSDPEKRRTHGKADQCPCA